jgi:sugar lactone lactonase YvrE
LYWTGFYTGDIGRVSFDGDGRATVKVLGNIGAGANAIAFSNAGKLLVDRAVIGDGLYEIDTTGATPPRQIAAALGNVNAFAFGPDGQLYGPRSGVAPAGALVRIDPATGSVTMVAAGLGLPSAVKISADGRTAYLTQSGPPAAIEKVDLQTAALTQVATVPAKVLDNLALGPDGTIYVSYFDQPEISVIGPGGETRTMNVGHA